MPDEVVGRVDPKLLTLRRHKRQEKQSRPGRPRTAFLHLLYSSASPHSDDAFVTRDLLGDCRSHRHARHPTISW